MAMDNDPFGNQWFACRKCWQFQMRQSDNPDGKILKNPPQVSLTTIAKVSNLKRLTKKLHKLHKLVI
jgi:hypothetical protein